MTPFCLLIALDFPCLGKLTIPTSSKQSLPLIKHLLCAR
jgi:hypothetical protein